MQPFGCTVNFFKTERHKSTHAKPRPAAEKGLKYFLKDGSDGVVEAFGVALVIFKAARLDDFVFGYIFFKPAPERGRNGLGMPEPDDLAGLGNAVEKIFERP